MQYSQCAQDTFAKSNYWKRYVACVLQPPLHQIAKEQVKCHVVYSSSNGCVWNCWRRLTFANMYWHQLQFCPQACSFSDVMAMLPKALLLDDSNWHIHKMCRILCSWAASLNLQLWMRWFHFHASGKFFGWLCYGCSPTDQHDVTDVAVFRKLMNHGTKQFETDWNISQLVQSKLLHVTLVMSSSAHCDIQASMPHITPSQSAMQDDWSATMSLDQSVHFMCSCDAPTSSPYGPGPGYVSWAGANRKDHTHLGLHRNQAASNQAFTLIHCPASQK